MSQQLIPVNGLLQEMKYNDYMYNNTLFLDCEIERESQVLFCRQLRRLAEKELAKPEEDREHIKIRISSFGGMVWSVFAMVSYMEYWQEQGIIIETYCDGYTASGGSKILMAGSKGYRYMTRYGTVLIHQSNGGGYAFTLQEKIKEVEESLKDWKTICDMFRKHTKLTEQDIKNFTEANIDFTYRPQECLEKSIVDHII
jgi:ATP-dependent protease ClpP protease subunit